MYQKDKDMKQLKYVVKDSSGNILHYSYTKKLADEWVRKNKDGIVYKSKG